ncbi:MAG: hypothetical protein ACMUIM_11565 [bacterium]
MTKANPFAVAGYERNGIASHCTGAMPFGVINLTRAWKRMQQNKGTAGNNGISIRTFPAFVREPWHRIRQWLREGRYKPLPVMCTQIPKRFGGKRPPGIPIIAGRLIYQAIQ